MNFGVLRFIVAFLFSLELIFRAAQATIEAIDTDKERSTRPSKATINRSLLANYRYTAVAESRQTAGN